MTNDRVLIGYYSVVSSRGTERAAAGALTLGRFAVSYLAEQGYGLEVLIHAQAGWFWCKQVRIAEDGRMEPFGPVEALNQGTAFRRTDHHPVGQLVYELQAESERFGDHAGGPRHHANAHHDAALGPALPPRIREASRYARPVGGSWRMDET
jgi:hypothetical protein